MNKYTVTYYDARSHKEQTETFGMYHCAHRFASAMDQHDEHRLVEVYDVYRNRPVELEGVAA